MYNNYFRLKSDNSRGFTIESSWSRDYDDVAYNIRLYEDKQNIANVVICLDETIDHSSEFVKINEVREYIENSFDEFKNLPKLSKTSKLLQSCYEDVYSNDSDMCHIDSETWQYMKDVLPYSDNDLVLLQNEVKNYQLDNVLEVGTSTDEYVIVGYSDLITEFNDDRNLVKENLNEYMVEKILSEHDIRLSRVPFEDYGSDEESNYMYSFSKLYNEILDKLDIPTTSIITNELSDGKYEMIVDDNITIELRAWDQYKDVLDNINMIEEIQLKKDLEEDYEM